MPLPGSTASETGGVGKGALLYGEFEHVRSALQQRISSRCYNRIVRLIVPQYISRKRDGTEDLTVKPSQAGSFSVYLEHTLLKSLSAEFCCLRLTETHLSTLISRPVVASVVEPARFSCLCESQRMSRDAACVALVAAPDMNSEPAVKLFFSCDSTFHQSLGLDTLVQAPSRTRSNRGRTDFHQSYICVDLSARCYFNCKLPSYTNHGLQTTLNDEEHSDPETPLTDSNYYLRIMNSLLNTENFVSSFVGCATLRGIDPNVFKTKVVHLIRSNGSPICNVVRLPFTTSVRRVEKKLPSMVPVPNISMFDELMMLSMSNKDESVRKLLKKVLAQMSASLIEYFGLITNNIPVSFDQFCFSTNAFSSGGNSGVSRRPNNCNDKEPQFCQTYGKTFGDTNVQLDCLTVWDIESREALDSGSEGNSRGVLSGEATFSIIEMLVSYLRASVNDVFSIGWFMFAISGVSNTPAVTPRKTHGYGLDGDNEAYCFCYIGENVNGEPVVRTYYIETSNYFGEGP